MSYIVDVSICVFVFSMAYQIMLQVK